MRLFALFLMLPSLAFAQVEQQTLGTTEPEALLPEGEGLLPEDVEIPAGPERIAPETVVGETLILRGLDKMTGRVADIPLEVGATVEWERLEITALTCRATVPGEKADAYAWLEIRDTREILPSFVGWMIASSPGLNAMDHPRYDVWVTNCNTSSGLAVNDSASQSE